MPSAKFEEVYAKAGAIKSGPTNDELLKLYSLAKVAKGDDISTAKKPGVFDLPGKKKLEAWKKLVDEGKSQKEAETEYIAHGEEMIKKYGK